MALFCAGYTIPLDREWRELMTVHGRSKASKRQHQDGPALPLLEDDAAASGEHMRDFSDASSFFALGAGKIESGTLHIAFCERLSVSIKQAKWRLWWKEDTKF